jgi:hypothetical protein
MSMLADLVVAMTLVPLLLFGWIGVQWLWRARLTALDQHGDVLAGRTGCGHCGCDTPCEQRNDAATDGGHDLERR